jgi:hypothetical protein
MIEQGLVVGVVWYRSREDFDRLKLMFDDCQRLKMDYDEWLSRAERELDRRVKEGEVIEKIYLDADFFPEWCYRQNLKIDAKARINFVDYMVKVRFGRRN